MKNITRCYENGHIHEGWLDLCESCGASHVEHAKFPETVEDIGILRAAYNRRHQNEPGFVPSVPYDKDGRKILN
jgi:hypothetical protein